MSDDLIEPGPEERVCPRCGSPAAGHAFCGGCGFDLRSQGELPTHAEWVKGSEGKSGDGPGAARPAVPPATSAEVSEAVEQAPQERMPPEATPEEVPRTREASQPPAPPPPPARPAQNRSMPEKWLRRKVRDKQVTLICPSCHKHNRFPLAAFKGQTGEEAARLTKTEAVLSPGNDTTLRWLLAIAVFFIVHRAVAGPGAPINEGFLIPTFAAALTFFGIAPLLGAGLRALFGRRLPVHSFNCPKCEAENLVASNGEVVMVPDYKPFKCSDCGGSFASKDALAQHRAAKHSM